MYELREFQQHGYCLKDPPQEASNWCMVSYYRSDYYAQKLEKASSHLLYKDSGKLIAFPPLILMQYRGSRCEQLLLWLGLDQRQERLWGDLLVQQPWDNIKHVLHRMQHVTIDGMLFLGMVWHSAGPVPFTYAAFSSAATTLRTNFYGPELPEVFEILSALRTLPWSS